MLQYMYIYIYSCYLYLFNIWSSIRVVQLTILKKDNIYIRPLHDLPAWSLKRCVDQASQTILMPFNYILAV